MCNVNLVDGRAWNSEAGGSNPLTQTIFHSRMYNRSSEGSLRYMYFSDSPNLVMAAHLGCDTMRVRIPHRRPKLICSCSSMVEQRADNAKTLGSIPIESTIFYPVLTAGNGQYPFKIPPPGWGSIPPRDTKFWVPKVVYLCIRALSCLQHIWGRSNRPGSTKLRVTKAVYWVSKAQ